MYLSLVDGEGHGSGYGDGHGDVNGDGYRNTNSPTFHHLLVKEAVCT